MAISLGRNAGKPVRSIYLWHTKMRPQINKIRKAIRQELIHLRHNLGSIDALTDCGADFLATDRSAYQKLLVISILVRDQMILDQSDNRSIPDHILSQALIKPIVRCNTRYNDEFGAKF